MRPAKSTASRRRHQYGHEVRIVGVGDTDPRMSVTECPTHGDGTKAARGCPCR